jgi:tryptophan-rich sensory protein
MGTSLHAAAAVGAWWVWLAEGGRLSSPALMCFCVMLLLSGLWPMFLLRLRSPKWGWRAIALAWLAAWATLGLFWLTEPISGWWVLPILLWLSYCLWVTHALQRMNRA